MLVTPRQNRRNFVRALSLAIAIAAAVGVAGWLRPAWWFALPLAGLAFWLARRRTLRRLEAAAAPFPRVWESVLRSDVAFFSALDEPARQRFRRLVLVFLDEVRITGIGTEVDERTRVLVAASAIIPVFGFQDWEYSGLGEVLIYPSAFGSDYRVGQDRDQTTLGMVGLGHLSGVMILSKPDLIGGFTNPRDKRNVGIHEFAHLVDKADGSVDGVPPGVSSEVYGPWIEWVGQELSRDRRGRSHVNEYGYTNEAEYFAVLTEYFFEAPETLKRKDPRLYGMLESMFRQDASRLLTAKVLGRRRRRMGRNAPCPCGSGQKYKRCCLRAARRGLPRG